MKFRIKKKLKSNKFQSIESFQFEIFVKFGHLIITVIKKKPDFFF